MEVYFDPKKDASNIRKHRISLRRAKDFDFATAQYELDDSQDYGEVRFNALGFIDATLYSLTFTAVAEDIRAISLRKAERQEQRNYEEIN